MKSLFGKELTLALHPTSLIFLGLSAMVLIPNYPYYVIFFYTGLGIFFICLSGRENQDITYSLMLPVAKRDLVSARFCLVILIQCLQILITIPFICLRNILVNTPNLAGMDANFAMLGFSWVLLGLYNIVFFRVYYRNVQKVGTAFLWSSLVIMVFIGLAEALVFAFPSIQATLDNTLAELLGTRLLVFGIGFVLYGLLTFYSLKKARQHFAQQDL